MLGSHAHFLKKQSFSYKIPGPEQTSLTSGDTRDKFQNPSATKTYSVGFSHDAELSCKNEVIRSRHSGDILCKRIKQFDWQREFWDKNSRIRLLNSLK